MYLITGATGNTGSALVDLLHAEGHDVRVLVRDASRAERFPHAADVAVGDLDDVDSLRAAVRGTEAVFHLQAANDTTQTANMIDAMTAGGVRRIVALTSMGARLKPAPTIGARFVAREQLLADSGLDVTYVRPGTLMSNALWWVDEIRATGRVVDPTGPGRTAPVDTDDVARVAAVALTGDGHVGKGYLLTGPEALTTREQVGILSDVLGRPIDVEDTTPEEMARDAVAHGTPAAEAEALADLNAMFRAGRAGIVTDDVQNVTGVAPRTFRDWCERHAGDFPAA